MKPRCFFFYFFLIRNFYISYNEINNSKEETTMKKKHYREIAKRKAEAIQITKELMLNGTLDESSQWLLNHLIDELVQAVLKS